MKEGMPELPVKALKLIIPGNATLPWIEVVYIKTEEFEVEYPIMPGKEPIPIGYEKEFPKMYKEFKPDDKTEMVYPVNVVNFEGVGKMREFNIANVSIFPFQYYSGQKKLVFIKEVEFILHYQLEGKTLSVKQFKDRDKTVQETVCSYIANKDDFNKFYQTAENTSQTGSITSKSQLKSTTTGISIDCDYVIVTTDNYVSSLNEFVAWKRRKGIKIEVVNINQVLSNYSGDVVSGINDDAGKLRQFLYDTYSNSQCFQYALFIDDGNIPIRYLHHYSNETDPEKIYPSDYYFADFDIDWEKDGDNNHGEFDDLKDDIWPYEPDIFVGRLLVQNTDELRNWIRKVILYETDPGKGNRDYLTKAYFTEADLVSIDYVTDKLTWCTTIEKDFEQGGPETPETPVFPTGQGVINKFNNRYGVAGFFAHGSETSVAVATKGNNVNDPLSKYGVTSLDAYNNTSNSGCCLIPENGNGFDNMTNYDHPIIFLSASCKTMPFDDFGYSSSIRNMGESYTVISKGGGPVYIGNTRNGGSPSTNMILGKMIELSTDTTFFNIGKLMGISKEIDGNRWIGRPIKYSLNLLGCPEIELWTATPSTFSSASVSQNGSNVTVNTGGISNCTICLMSAYDNGSSYFNVQSNVSSYTFPDVDMPYYVTITKHNKIPYLKNLTNVLFENKTFNSNAYISCQTLSAGYSVDPNHTPDGNVVIASGASVTFDATGDILLSNGFEVQLGATFEAK